MTEEKKGQDDPKDKGDKKDDGQKDQKDQLDPKIAEIMKDPDAVQSLLDQKRAANAEAKKYREKLEDIENARKKSDEDVLKEQGKFKELAETAQREKGEAEARFKAKAIELALRTEAIRLGIIDPADVKLADASQVKIDKEWNIEGAKEAVEALKAAKAYLFEKKEGTPPPPGPKPGLRGQENEGNLTPHERMMKSKIE